MISNTGPFAARVHVDDDTEMKAYDALPEVVRHAIGHCIVDVSAAEIADLLERYPPEVVARSIANMRLKP